MGRHLPSLGRGVELEPIDNLAWNFPTKAGPALALHLIRTRLILPPYGNRIFKVFGGDEATGTGPTELDWDDIVRTSGDQLCERLDELDQQQGYRVDWLQFPDELPLAFLRDIRFSQRVRTGRAKTMLLEAAERLGPYVRKDPAQGSPGPIALTEPGRELGQSVERCFWRGYGLESGAVDLGHRGLPTPNAILTSRAQPPMERLRCWVDSLLVRLSDLKAGSKVYVPECFDGHLLVRATEALESRQGPQGSREELLELHGQSKTPEAFELASLRTYLHGLQSSTHLQFLSADDPFKFHGACDVAFANRAFDPSVQEVAEDRVALVIGVLRSLRPTGCAVVALPLKDTYNRQTNEKDSVQEGRLLTGFQLATPSLRSVRTPAQLRELLVREGLLRAVIGLPGNVGVLLLIEGVDRRGVKDDPQQSQVLFVTLPENWHTIHKLGLQQTPEPKSQRPLEAIVSLVEEERRGRLPASNPSDPGSKFRPFFTWVSRTELEQKKFELKLPTPSQPGSDIPDILTSADFSDLRTRLADLEAQRDEVARRMDGALERLEEDF